MRKKLHFPIVSLVGHNISHSFNNLKEIINGQYVACLILLIHIYDHSFPLRGKAPKENETQVPLTQQVVIC